MNPAKEADDNLVSLGVNPDFVGSESWGVARGSMRFWREERNRFSFV
jgi:hypothetical protein